MRLPMGILISLLLGLATPALGTPAKAVQLKDLPQFKQADNNDDGRLTFKELRDEKIKVPKKRFQSEDLNGDGQLTKYDYQYGLK